MTYSALWFSELQFFISLSFMAVFFAISFGLSWLLFYLRFRARGEAQRLWLPMYRFWVRIFALAYVVSFASSMPVLVQLGSLWPALIPKIYAISSPILAVALLGALVFKAGFLGLMLYGQRQLADGVHLLIILAVAIGNTLVGASILALVSWMHTPTGVEWTEGRYQVISWSEVLSNPSFLPYGLLMLFVSFVLVAALMMAVLALQSLRRPLAEGERRVFKLAVYVGLAAWVALFFASWGNALMVAAHQPFKAAATMAYWVSESAPSWLWFAWPTATDMQNLAAVGMPNTGALWLAKDGDGSLIGLDQIAGMGPPVAVVFWSFRLALLCGLALLLLFVWGWRLGRASHYDPSSLSVSQRRIFVFTGALGPALLVMGLAYQLLGMLPFAVNQSITLTEVYARHPIPTSLFSLMAYVLTYSLIAMGFIVLVRYVARYGVIAVARHRGRA